MTDTSLDQELAEELDFPVPCGHSGHNTGGQWHGGDAQFVAVSYHRCPAQPGKPPPYYYPCCAVWAGHVLRCTAQGLTIQCARCGDTGYWEHMVQIIRVL